MPIADWLKRIVRERSQDFLIAPLDEKNGAPKSSPVEVDTEYATLRIEAAEIGVTAGIPSARSVWVSTQIGSFSDRIFVSTRSPSRLVIGFSSVAQARGAVSTSPVARVRT
jgi:hypothetical protein